MGRPSYEPSAEQREQVRKWKQAKVSIEEMARRVELAPKTFRKHFAAELGLLPTGAVNTELVAAKQQKGGGFRPTDEQRESALILAGARWPYQDIANYLRLDSVDVLEEHFADELAQGPVKFPAEVIKASWFAARAGNQTAAKICLIMSGTGPADPGAKQQPAAEGLKGKKAAAAIGAKNGEVGTGWEDLIRPSNKPN